MGMECPNGHGRQNVVRNITADGGDPVKASEIVAKKLACGCVVGGEDYEKFREAVEAIDLDRTNAVRKIEEAARKKKATAYNTYVVKHGGGENAE